MEEELDIILSAVDNASDTFEEVASAAEGMGNSIEQVAESASGIDQVQASAEEAAAGLGDMQGSAEDAGYSMEQLIDYCQNMYSGAIQKVADETERAKEESDEASNSFSNLSSILEGIAGAEIFSKMADALWEFADKAGSYSDSMMRARLEAEGAGISVNEMTDAVSELSATTGRAGGEIRESFIKATARGITDMDSFKSMMEGAGAQATLLGTDIQTMGDKFSSMAQRSTLMERQLASTGITMEELADAMNMSGATADEVKAKWEELDTNQRAAILGQAASMNEGKTANEEYKKSWEGLQAQLDIAKGRLERLAGEVLLPVLIPAMELAARVLDWLGDTISAVMKGPLGGLISVIGSVAAAFMLAVPAYMAISAAIGFVEASAIPAAVALWSMVAPLLPFIAIGAAVVLVIYEIGKAFGWWTDVSSMLDAIWAGIQRLWSAFINHPDVQGFLAALGNAWNAILPYIQSAVSWVMSFFNNSSGEKFDIVSMWINNIGMAWNAITAPIKLVIRVIQLLWQAMATAGKNIQNTINNIRNWFAQLPSRIKSAISTIVSVVTQPFRDAYNGVVKAIDDIKNYVTGLTNIDLSGITSAITKPFSDAYNKVCGVVDDIKNKANEITGGIFNFGGPELAYGGLDLLDQEPSSVYSTERMSIDLKQDIGLTLDLKNVPSGMDETLLRATLDETLRSKEFINALVTNSDFQSLDSKVKARISAKKSRARGV